MKLTYLALVPLALLLTACPSPRPDPLPTPDPLPSVSPAPVGTVDSPYGVTLDDVASLSDALRSWGALPVRPWVRVVFDPRQAPAYYASAVNTLLAQGYPVMGELLDSFDVPGCSLACYQTRAAAYGDAFGASITYEVGNEVNGSWLGSGVGAKVSAAYRVLHARGYRTAVTGYLCTYGGNEPLMDAWLATNLPDDVRAGVDYAFVSHYEGDCADSPVIPTPVPTSYWEGVYSMMGHLFPHAQLGMGETGIGVDAKGNERGSPADRAAYLSRYYSIHVTHPRYRVKGWWWFQGDLLPAGTPSWNALAGAMK
jgi:hypothetical protein